MRLLVVVVALLLGASGCDGDEAPTASRIESELRQALAVVLDRGYTVGCVDRGGGKYGCSVKSGPVGVPASEDDPFIYAELVDVTCDRRVCTWSLVPGDAPGRRSEGSFSLE